MDSSLGWEGLGAGGEGANRGWDGWMASRPRRMWVWVNSGRWWWTGRPGMLRFMWSQRVGHDWATELNWTELNAFFLIVWGWLCRLFFSVVFLVYKCPFNICCKGGLIILNFLNFCLFEKLFISPSILNEILAGCSNLGWRFFFFSTLNISCYSPLVCRVSP